MSQQLFSRPREEMMATACIITLFIDGLFNNNKSNNFFAKLPSVFSSSSSNKNDDAITGVIGNDDVDDNDDESSSKFDMAQRIESLKSIVLGAIAGGIGVTPIAYLHYVYFASATEPNGLAQWEFVTDMSSIEAGLFAIVYRYAVRKNDNNPMLNQGVVGAFIIVRSLSNIHVTETCKAIPLRCGPPLGYFDWNMITQGAWNGVESVALFGVAALAMEFAFQQKWISKFD
ncbi:hypothetical protein FRACYDRAFT_246671 [Fragilariopsis cylindrus CCMP1102]|uniref:Uncharacterized protein n=1 Tax=Fragilariopsis cylindrus CCMP1102 TaxID=635003 RepID=A0A1E7EY09_9STRA|nr:hypothetical protein FRACYDRAFT_246671 [Fragilariopsis cylindrus CCMP1102]|eukprot:OEU10802.1 hypothetical protein FRACYDRAFT_246671 [Fragilariopsis cylindrus CCMP1102]